MGIATVGIGCFRGCGQAVIGQCQGYKDSCGRFYCATHSVGKLCSDCGERKLKDEETQKRQELEAQAREQILAQYTQLAEKLEKEISETARKRANDVPNMIIGISFLISMGLMAYTLIATESWGPIGVLLFIIALIAMIVKTVENRDVKKAHYEKRLAEISIEYQGFNEFYPEWKQLKDLKAEAERQEKAKKFNAVVSLLAGTAVDTYKYIEKEAKKAK